MPQAPTTVTNVRCGADRLLNDAVDLIKGRRVGILTNHTGRLANGESTVDAIVRSDAGRVTALFGPEHGLKGNAANGSAVEHTRHEGSDIPVYSLYGKTVKPTAAMLGEVDVLVCDIQDVGARFYTYLTTIALALEAAAEAKVSFVLLDRPNPVRGLSSDGPVREERLRSFVGWMPVPILHGMTYGELATLWNEEGWLSGRVHAKLEVVPLEGWRRSMWYDETGLAWVTPSPNLPRLTSAIVYPGQCLFEGTSISEGRGTASPFELVGAPWADAESVIQALEEFSVPGAKFTTESFTPREIPGVAANPKYAGEKCRGVRVTVVDRNILRPVRLGIAMLAAFLRVHPQETRFRVPQFDELSGSVNVRKMLERGAHPDEICANWMGQVKEFDALRRQYLLYP